MRTEDDLRQALATLERHAPSADTVLARVRRTHAGGRPGPAGSAGSAGGGRRRRTGWWRRPRLALSLAAARGCRTGDHSAAGLHVAADRQRARSDGVAPSRARPGGAALGGLRGPGHADRVSGGPRRHRVHRANRRRHHGRRHEREPAGSWPAQPDPGQQQVERTVWAERTHRVAGLAVVEDSAVGYTTPAAGVQAVRGQVTMVCYAGTGQPAAHGTEADPARNGPGHPEGEGVHERHPAPAVLSPADLARGIAKGTGSARRTRLEGQPANDERTPGPGPLRPAAYPAVGECPHAPAEGWSATEVRRVRGLAGGHSRTSKVAAGFP